MSLYEIKRVILLEGCWYFRHILYTTAQKGMKNVDEVMQEQETFKHWERTRFEMK